MDIPLYSLLENYVAGSCMRVVLVEVEDEGSADALARGLAEISEELELDELQVLSGVVELKTRDPVGAHLKISRFPGVHRVGVFEKVPSERAKDALVEVAGKVLRSDMTFELSVRTIGENDSVKLYYELMRHLIESVDAKPNEVNPERLLRVLFVGGHAYVEYFGVTGPGGLPIGLKGEAVLAFSGGFKSYVASIRACRAGLRPYLVFVHPPKAPKAYVRRAFYKAWTLLRGLPMREISLFIAKPDEALISKLGFFGVLASAMEKVGRELGVRYVILGLREADEELLKGFKDNFILILPNFGLSKFEMELSLMNEEDRHKLDWSSWKPEERVFRGKGDVEIVKVKIGRGPVGWHEALDRYSNGEL